MTPAHVQTKREIEALLAGWGLRPRKRFGQHFLIDGNLMRRLHESAGLSGDDLALEVGPGTGGLTDLLVASGCQVVVAEIDRDLCSLLEDRFADEPRFTLISGDALASKHKLHPDLDAAIRQHGEANAGPVKLVANLPYQVATPLVMNLLIDYPQVRRLCFTVQAEVGERITARPGTKAFGPLSITSQLCCRIKTIARIGPKAFWPAPRVDSVMLRMDVGENPLGSQDRLRAFASVVQGVFSHRRKTLRSALGYVLDDTQRERVCQLVDASRRPEALDMRMWIEMFDCAYTPNSSRQPSA